MGTDGPDGDKKSLSDGSSRSGVKRRRPSVNFVSVRIFWLPMTFPMIMKYIFCFFFFLFKWGGEGDGIDNVSIDRAISLYFARLESFTKPAVPLQSLCPFGCCRRYRIGSADDECAASSRHRQHTKSSSSSPSRLHSLLETADTIGPITPASSTVNHARQGDAGSVRVRFH